MILYFEDHGLDEIVGDQEKWFKFQIPIVGLLVKLHDLCNKV